QLPPGASLERTNGAVEQLRKIAQEVDGVAGVASLVGFNFLTGLTTSYSATTFVRLKPWDERKQAGQDATGIVRTLSSRANREIKDANAIVLNPTPIRGLGATGGFEFILDRKSTRLNSSHVSIS